MSGVKANEGPASNYMSSGVKALLAEGLRLMREEHISASRAAVRLGLPTAKHLARLGFREGVCDKEGTPL